MQPWDSNSTAPFSAKPRSLVHESCQLKKKTSTWDLVTRFSLARSIYATLSPPVCQNPANTCNISWLAVSRGELAASMIGKRGSITPSRADGTALAMNYTGGGYILRRLGPWGHE